MPRATARLQFHNGFTLDDGAALVPYFAELGISHLYASPVLRARSGSTHGYDVADPTMINPEIGGEPALLRLVAALRAHGLGLIVDIVPNHMGTGPDNPWWQHMLQWGAASPYGRFFDVNWQSSDPFLTGKILLPALGGQYGDELSAGRLQLRYGDDPAGFAIGYYDTPFPVRPADYGRILAAGGLPGESRLAALLSSAATEKPGSEHWVHEDLAAFSGAEEGRATIGRALAVFNGADRTAMHQLLERQNYRLAWWRTANDEINWRRFFDVNELAGLRIERGEVFEAAHALLFRLYAEGLADGFRIDHVDGLALPGDYCRKLRARLAELAPQRPPEAPSGPAYIVVEKILAAGENLSEAWEIDGTSGYDFMDQVSAVLHDRRGTGGLNAVWNEVSGGPVSFAAFEHDARLQMIDESFRAEVEALSSLLLRIARRSLDTRDTSLAAIRRTLEELLAHFPVYRTYAGTAGRSPADDAVMARAMDGARPHLRPGEEPLLDVLGRWLGGTPPDRVADASERALRNAAITRFQQLTSPVAAKSVEDTSFYRYGRLISRNEVGSDPGLLSISAEEFHERCRKRGERFPDELLATATHDHKRGEDARVRLAVLSEMPEEWAAAVRSWRAMNAELRLTTPDGTTPDPVDELMLYQTLVGAWPLHLAADDAQGLAALCERVSRWQVKALREAKRHTRWIAQNEPYEAGCKAFAEALLTAARGGGFRASLAELVARIAPAGCLNGLSQTVLRLTTPGVPDLYQGTELWDFSLVDPDNRAPVDFDARRTALAASGEIGALPAEWRSGAIKQAVIARVLRFRRSAPELFARGSYEPLSIEGPNADNALAFLRRGGGRALLVVVPRCAASLLAGAPTVPAEAWGETAVALPEASAARWRDIVGGGTVSAAGGRLALSEALARGPVCVLTTA